MCEASSLGVPSIFPDSGGIKEFFPEDYELAFDYDSDEDLISKLSEVVNRSKMSNNGILNQEFISKLLDREEMYEKFEKIISK